MFLKDISEKKLLDFLKNNIFTSLEDFKYLNKKSLINIFVSDYGFVEINSWYKITFQENIF